MLELIRGEKEVQENLTFAYDSVETENKNKEVLECQLVTTSWSQDNLVKSESKICSRRIWVIDVLSGSKIIVEEPKDTMQKLKSEYKKYSRELLDS